MLLRRINIRQVVDLKGNSIKIDKTYFKKFKRIVNNEINRPMLQKLLPYGSVLKNVYLEINVGNSTYGRQIGSYPILIYLPYKTSINKFVDVRIYDHGYRSVSAIEYPLNINKTGFTMLKNIPFIGKKIAAKLVRNKSIKSKDELKKIIGENMTNWFSI